MEEIIVNRIDDIYKIVNQKESYFRVSERNPYDGVCLFFRGQADYSWPLKPSIKRDEGLIEVDELKDIDSNSDDLFEYIAKCQHYGKKTRFLDYSTNVDVALFFACYDDDNKYRDKDASLFICPYRPRKKVWCDTIIISELSLLRNEISVGNFASDLLKKYDQLKKKFGNVTELAVDIVSWLDHGFMVLPDDEEYEKLKKNNSRIVAQQGAFFICGNKTKTPLVSWNRISSHAVNNIILPEVEEVPDTVSESEFVAKIRIPSDLKRDILTYLDYKGINKRKLLM